MYIIARIQYTNHTKDNKNIIIGTKRILGTSLINIAPDFIIAVANFILLYINNRIIKNKPTEQYIIIAAMFKASFVFFLLFPL